MESGACQIRFRVQDGPHPSSLPMCAQSRFGRVGKGCYGVLIYRCWEHPIIHASTGRFPPFFSLSVDGVAVRTSTTANPWIQTSKTQDGCATICGRTRTSCESPVSIRCNFLVFEDWQPSPRLAAKMFSLASCSESRSFFVHLFTIFMTDLFIFFISYVILRYHHNVWWRSREDLEATLYGSVCFMVSCEKYSHLLRVVSNSYPE